MLKYWTTEDRKKGESIFVEKFLLLWKILLEKRNFQIKANNKVTR